MDKKKLIIGAVVICAGVLVFLKNERKLEYYLWEVLDKRLPIRDVP